MILLRDRAAMASLIDGPLPHILTADECLETAATARELADDLLDDDRTCPECGGCGETLQEFRSYGTWHAWDVCPLCDGKGER